MNEQAAVSLLVEDIREYAASRANDVARGSETPRLAALMLQKYGRGMCDAVAAIFDNRRAADPISDALDEETSRIDPHWREHDRERRAAHLADLAITK